MQACAKTVVSSVFAHSRAILFYGEKMAESMTPKYLPSVVKGTSL